MEDVLEFLRIDTQIIIGQNVQKGQPGHAWVRINGLDIDSVWFIPNYWRLKNFQRDVEVYDDFSQYAINRGLPMNKW